MDQRASMPSDGQKATVSKSYSGLKKEKMPGPDGRMAWVVAFACCMINFIMAGLGRMSGILFVAFIEVYGVDRKSASMPFSVRSSAGNLFGPVVGILGQKYGARKIIVIGGIVGTISSAACFFAPDVMWITVLWGGVNGLGSALTVTLPQVVIGQYFDKHRTTAAGIAFSGGCLGSFVFPMLLEYLLDNFGIEGTFLIIGAIIMHTIPAALILKKPSWLKQGSEHKAVYELSQSSDNGEIEHSTSNELVSNCLKTDISSNIFSINECTTKKNSTSSIPTELYPNIGSLKNGELAKDSVLLETERKISNVLADNNQNNISGLDLDEIQRAEKNTDEVCINAFFEEPKFFVNLTDKNMVKSFPRRELPGVHVKTINIPSSDLSELLPQLADLVNLEERMASLPLKNAPLVMAEFENLPETKTSMNEVKKLESSKGSDSKDIQSVSLLDHIKTAFKLYANPLFIMVCLCRAVHFIAFIPAMTTVVDFSMDKGLLEDQAKFAIAAISMGDLLGRLCFGWVTDRGFMTLPKYMMTVMIAQGIGTASLPMMHTEMTIFSNLALFGMLQGSLFVRHPVLISKYMKSNEQSIAMGCVNFISGIIGFGLPLYIGYFRDTMGSYDCIFYLNGLLGACVGLLWIFEPFFVRCANKRLSQKLSIV